MHQNRTPIPCHRPSGWWAIAGLALTLSGCAGLPGQRAPEGSVRGGFAADDQVALLLPTEGPLLGVADAVRDGVRASARADDSKTQPKLVPLEGSAPDRVGGTLDQAVEAGATHVIGPLDKASVEALATRGGLRVPTLALNETTSIGKPASNLFQFSLSPETDAVEAANKAQALGLGRALMLYPDDPGGKRRAEAFRAHWSRLGGTLIGESAFKPSAPGDPPKIQGLLAKGGADLVFLAANSDQARAIYPQIRESAADLTVIATSDVYAGDPDPSRDRALAGLYFVDMPWMLGVEMPGDPLKRADVKGTAAHLATPLGRRLYAMGIDAYRLAPRLEALATDPGASLSGQTGRLSIDALGRVRRELTLARFTASGPEVVAGVAAQGPTSQARSPRPERGKGG